MVCRFPINKIANNKALAPIFIRISGSESLLNGKGRITALTPRIQNVLNMFEPITLPMAMSACFLYAATAEVASSGNEVPMATTVKPIRD